MKLICAVAVLILSESTIQACLWDDDTLKMEARDAPDAITIITGRFERFPPRYYEMRLKRVLGEVAQDPNNLSLYDNAGVACDRLHRSDNAIEWMRKKQLVLKNKQSTEHLYRYHANLGTFLVHKWIREGADFTNIELIEEGRDHIAKAIQINPDAHFGRERYQLMAMDWMMEAATLKRNGDIRNISGTFFDSELSWRKKERDESDEAIQGIGGLIYLGSAWESIDIFNSYGVALVAENHTSLYELTRLRVKELKGNGKSSLVGEMAERIETYPYQLRSSAHLPPYFQKARQEADQWQKARWDYMNEQFNKGLHPDSSPDFWDTFNYKGKPARMPVGAVRPPFYYFLFVVKIGFLLLLLMALVQCIRKKRTKIKA